MTEQEWFSCTTPPDMLRHISGKIPNRKLRLFGCACLREIWSELPEPSSRAAVEAAEKHVDNRISLDSLREAQKQAQKTAYSISQPAAFAAALIAGPLEVQHAEQISALTAYYYSDDLRETSEVWVTRRKRHCQLLREIVGNPFHRVLFDDRWFAWQDGLVCRMAASLYDNEGSSEIPALTDALVRAGCDDPHILEHLQSGKDHVRGCWVLDALRVGGSGLLLCRP